MQRSSLSLWGATGLTLTHRGTRSRSSLIYALHASGTTAYVWVKTVNSFLMLLAVFPINKMVPLRAPAARICTDRRRTRRHCRPVPMHDTTLAMSDNLALPVVHVQRVGHALGNPRHQGTRRDAVLLVSIAAATATRAADGRALPGRTDRNRVCSAASQAARTRRGRPRFDWALLLLATPPSRRRNDRRPRRLPSTLVGCR